MQLVLIFHNPHTEIRHGQRGLGPLLRQGPTGRIHVQQNQSDSNGLAANVSRKAAHRARSASEVV